MGDMNVHGNPFDILRKNKNVNRLGEQEEKSGDHQSHWALSTGRQTDITIQSCTAKKCNWSDGWYVVG